MNVSRPVSTDGELRQMRRLLLGVFPIILIGGVFLTNTFEGMTGYVLVTVASVLPTFLWLRLGAPGVPVLPAIATFYYLYYAVPIVRENFDQIAASPADVMRAAITVSMFLVAASGPWWLITRERIRRPKHDAVEFVSVTQLRQLIVGGIFLGIAFQLFVILGWLQGLGTIFGVIRAVSLGVTGITFYLIGYCRARALLVGQFWTFALGGMGLIVALSWTTLFLVIGLQFLLAAVLGYVITTKRIPWKMLLPVLAVAFVLHAGKGEMRDQYWTEGAMQPDIPIAETPLLFGEWLDNGVTAIVTGQSKQDLFDRASLLYRLIFVEQLTPTYIPYLEGESYTYIGDFLLPRFLDPDKAASQAAMVLLNVHYGIETLEEARFTAIGWGIVAEAFANFGNIGVVVAGLIFGTLAAVFTCWSAGSPPIAMSTLLAIAALVSMTNVEADFSYMVVNLWQALAAVLIFFIPVKFMSRSKSRGMISRASAAPRQL